MTKLDIILLIYKISCALGTPIKPKAIKELVDIWEMTVGMDKKGSIREMFIAQVARNAQLDNEKTK